MGAAAIPIAVAAISAAGTVYAASQQPKVSAPKQPDLPALPNTQALAGSQQQADLMAKTAGGTISRPGQVGDAANTVRKTLLGT